MCLIFPEGRFHNVFMVAPALFKLSLNDKHNRLEVEVKDGFDNLDYL
jgi:hypothetical protein